MINNFEINKLNILDSGEERIGELKVWYKISQKAKRREIGGKYEYATEEIEIPLPRNDLLHLDIFLSRYLNLHIYFC